MIKRFNDGSHLEYARGSFDDWCVYLTRPGIPRYAPKDFEYFDRLKELAFKFGHKRIYNDFLTIYEKTTSQINPQVCDLISTITIQYGEDALEIDILLTILYAGMVAEENKRFAVLKKRIKRLGLHQVLIEGMAPTAAANYSRGKPAKHLIAECEKRGF